MKLFQGAESSSRPEIYDQVAEAGTLGCLGSSIDEYLEVAEPTATAGSRVEDGIPVTEEPSTKIVLGTDEVEQKTVGFTDKIKEFDAFLEDFDLQIKPRDPPGIDNRDPVTEEIIRPEVVVRPSARKNSGDRRDERSARSKRSLIDTPKSENRLVMKLAGKALRTLDDIDTDNKKRMILRLIDSKKEETADGTIYHVTMKVVPTECHEKNVKPEDCFDSPRGPAKICKMQIHTEDERPVESAKVLQSQCFPEWSRRRETRVRRSPRQIIARILKGTANPDVIDHGSSDMKIEPLTENVLPRARRSAQVVGGARQKSTDDKEIISYAKLGVDKFSKLSESSNEPFLIEIIEATAQVVSGMLYKIKVRLGESTCPKGTKENCQLKADGQTNNYLITVWSQPWIDHGSPDVKIEPLTDNELSRARRSAQIPGGPMHKSVDDADIREYTEKGIRKYSETSGLTSEPFLVKIIEATAQVVSGMLYKIRVRLGESTCPRGNRDNCQLRSGSPIRDFLITVWSQPWIDHGNPEIKVKEEASRTERSRRDTFLASLSKLSTDDEEVKNYARRALERYSDSSELLYEPILAEIKEAHVQTVSGKFYKINIVMAESNCSRGTRENCRAVETGETNECLVSVWSQPWIDHGEPEIKIKCDEKNRQRRSLRGANYSAKMLKLRKNIELEKRFDEFMEKFDIKYPTEEERTARFRVFKDNMKVIDELQRGEQGTAEYGVTMFADLTPEEFRMRYMQCPAINIYLKKFLLRSFWSFYGTLDSMDSMELWTLLWKMAVLSSTILLSNSANFFRKNVSFEQNKNSLMSMYIFGWLVTSGSRPDGHM